MDNIIAKKLHYYKQLQRKLDAYNTKASSLTFRKHILERQKLNNYQNEYDKIRGLLSQSTLRNVPDLKKRKDDLEKIGAIAVNSIR